MNEPLIRLKRGQTVVIGYGSLLSIRSVSRTLRREYDGPVVPCHVEGWRRAWNVSMPNAAFYYVDSDSVRVYPNRIVYLNVRTLPCARLNVMAFVVSDDELRDMHGREWIYDPIVVTRAVRGARIEGGDAIMYVARDEHIVNEISSRREAAIRASYLEILKGALDLTTADFREEYAQTTDPVREDLVINDVLDPDRPSPWEHTTHWPERHVD